MYYGLLQLTRLIFISDDKICVGIDYTQCLNGLQFALRLPYFRMILWHEMQLEGRKCFLTAEAVCQNFITLMFSIVYDFSD